MGSHTGINDALDGLICQAGDGMAYDRRGPAGTRQTLLARDHTPVKDDPVNTPPQPAGVGRPHFTTKDFLLVFSGYFISLRPQKKVLSAITGFVRPGFGEGESEGDPRQSMAKAVDDRLRQSFGGRWNLGDPVVPAYPGRTIA